jgi:glycosyltransferase involved in cell wall biosynthesis
MAAAKTRFRVGIITDKINRIGGLETTALRHREMLADCLEGVPVAIRYSGVPGDWRGRVTKTGSAYEIAYSDEQMDRVLSVYGSGDLDLSQRSVVDCLSRIVREERLDALHVYGAFRNRALVCAVAAVETGIKLVISFRGADLDLRVFSQFLGGLDLALRVASVCVCVNGKARGLVERLFRPVCPVQVIHNHVAAGDFSDAVPAIVGRLPRPVITCAAEFRRLTGLDYLLEAFEGLAGSVLLVGPFRPEEAQYYAGIIDTGKYSTRVFRVGRVPHAEMLGYMRASDVLVFPSLTDGCPNKVLEGMLSGTPVVSTFAGGIPELIRDGVDGVLVDPRSGELGAAIQGVLDEPERARRLVESAYARVTAEFTLERERAGWIEAYRAAGLC